MKKFKFILICTSLICSILSICLVVIPKREIPTDEEWQAYLAWEEEFLQWRDGPATEELVYQIQHRDTEEIYYIGSLQECKDNVKYYELTVGECVIMPCTQHNEGGYGNVNVR